jgi:hypothetical protein
MTASQLQLTQPALVTEAEQDVRAQLALLRARYDTGAIPQAVFSVIRKLEIELAWAEHR